jgi:hypothetical protein
MDDRPSVDLDPTRLLAAAPRDEYALLEFELGWPELNEVEERVAAKLRLFVITRDPLDWIPGRGPAWATANADGDVLELVVYVALDTLQHALRDDSDIVAAVARYGRAAVRSAATLEELLISGAQPALAAAGRVPRLLNGLDDVDALGIGAARVRSQGWEPLGLGAIQDLVQDAFGPVEFDRALVGLDPVEPHDVDCAACRGERFGFPGDLEVARPLLCPPHRAAALEVADARIARARASNPAGWRAIGKASARINGLPEPGGLPLPPRVSHSPGRNDPCPCGSGRKYKHCCGA